MTKDLINRLGATLIQILLALGTVSYAPIALPGLPEWVAVLAGVAVGLVGVVVHVFGVQSSVAAKLAQGTAVVGNVGAALSTVANAAAPQFTNTNTNIDLNAPGVTAAQAAAPARSVAAPVITPAAQFDQPVGPTA